MYCQQFFFFCSKTIKFFFFFFFFFLLSQVEHISLFKLKWAKLSCLTRFYKAKILVESGLHFCRVYNSGYNGSSCLRRMKMHRIVKNKMIHVNYIYVSICGLSRSPKSLWAWTWTWTLNVYILFPFLRPRSPIPASDCEGGNGKWWWSLKLTAFRRVSFENPSEFPWVKRLVMQHSCARGWSTAKSFQ